MVLKSSVRSQPVTKLSRFMSMSSSLNMSPTVRDERPMSETTIGSVMVVGGGITGMQAALDLADSGYRVHLVEGSSAIGGVMSELDKTFPTNDCAM
jgi:heterodisulfide reductase subunit A-like polyferredoxin